MPEVSPDLIREVDAVLQRTYKPEKSELLADTPVDSLVRTILSQNTNDRNRDLAFARLKQRFSSWEEAADAPEDEIQERIRSSNHSPTKARRIKEILLHLREEGNGKISLDDLKSLSTDEAMERLTRMEGVGKKTAACVLMFTLDRPVMPVDTHIHRVAQRLGWIGPKASKDAAHDRLNRIVPPEVRYTLHIEFWEHGRVVCRPTPRCAMCAIYRFCRYSEKTAPEPTEEEARERLKSVPSAQLAFAEDRPLAETETPGTYYASLSSNK
jgi:endonuclease-3